MLFLFLRHMWANHQGSVCSELQIFTVLFFLFKAAQSDATFFTGFLIYVICAVVKLH